MDSDEEMPLRSAKSLVRRLRNANDRHSRNIHLSSICPNNPKDVEMISSHSDEDNLENSLVDALVMQDQEEEELQNISAAYQQVINDASDVNLCSNGCDVNDDNDNDSFNYEMDDLVSDNVNSSLPTTQQISIALAFFRHRHNLSKSCINDLCDLLRSLDVQNVPADFRCIERNLIKNQEKILRSRKYFICPICHRKGNISSKCENIQCKLSTGFKSTPTTLCTFKLLPQITSILERHALMSEPKNDTSRLTDVQDGQIRRAVIDHERMLEPQRQVVTFLLNSDGVVVKKISRSIWVTCMIINELRRAIRFNFTNIIICSISIGHHKPKKTQFQNFIFDWVQELKQLELGFYISPPNSNGRFLKFHGYLIAASLDKPAQALLMNINEPIGFYSCIRCTIRGESVRSGRGSVRVFVRNKEDGIKDRTNDLYDEHIRVLSRRKTKPKTNQIDHAYGQEGPCLLRDLSYFNIGQSFVSDSREASDKRTTIKNDCKTRWNSSFSLCESLIALKHLIMKLFIKKTSLDLRKDQINKLSTIELRSEDWDLLTSLSKVLTSFSQATQMMSGKSYPTIGFTYCMISKIKSYCMKRSSNEYINVIKRLLIRTLDKYFYEDAEQLEYFQRFAFFDPSSHLRLSDKEKRQIENYVKNLFLDDIYPIPFQSTNNTSSSSAPSFNPSQSRQSAQPTQSKLTLYEQFLLSCEDEEVSFVCSGKDKSKRIAINDEIKLFRTLADLFNAKGDPSTHSAFTFWKINKDRLPILSHLAKTHLVACATSVPSESAFSLSAFLDRKERARLSSENLAYSVFLKDKM